jgi:predicted DNA-binding transcriptional regulator YafY
MAYPRIYNRHGYIIDFIKSNPQPNTKAILSHLSELGERVDARTVQRDIKTIEAELDYRIERKGSHPNRWYEIVEEPDEKTLTSRYLEHLSFAEILRREAKFEKTGRKAVFLDDTQLTRGSEHISAILLAIRSEQKVRVEHQKYEADCTSRVVCPLFLKQFRHRWYLIAREEETNAVKSFGLDRIVKVEHLKDQFSFRKEDNHDSMFAHVIGLYDNEGQPEKVRIWSELYHAGYLRSVKIHATQEEIGPQNNGFIFELNVVPNYEFFQTILMMEATVKILSPAWVVSRMKAVLKGTLHRYNQAT